MPQHEYNYLVWKGSLRVNLEAEPHDALLRLYWQGGERLQDVPRITATVSTQKLPDHMWIGRIEYVSLKLRNLLQAAGAEAEFFPVAEMITRRGKRIATAYFAMNVLRIADCFDYERSEFSRYPPELGGGPFSVERLAIHERLLHNAPLAVMRPFSLNLLRRDLVERMRAEQIHGSVWHEIESYADAMPVRPEES